MGKKSDLTARAAGCSPHTWTRPVCKGDLELGEGPGSVRLQAYIRPDSRRCWPRAPMESAPLSSSANIRPVMGPGRTSGFEKAGPTYFAITATSPSQPWVGIETPDLP